MRIRRLVTWTISTCLLFFSTVAVLASGPVGLWRDVSLGVKERQVGDRTHRVYSGADGARAAMKEIQTDIENLWTTYLDEPTDENWSFILDQERLLRKLEAMAADGTAPFGSAQDCAHWGVIYRGDFAAPLPFPQCGVSAGTAFLFNPNLSLGCGNCEVYARTSISRTCGNAPWTVKRARDGWKPANGPLATYANAQTTLTYPSYTACRTDHVAQAFCYQPENSFHSVIWKATGPDCGSAACAFCSTSGGPCLPGEC